MNQPPQDTQAEQSLLGTILQFESALVDVSGKLTPEDFYLPAHSLIFSAALTLFNEGNPVDATTVLAELDRSGKLVRIGGAPYLATLISSPLTADAAGYYAELILNASRRRRIQELGLRLEQASELEADEAVQVVYRFLDEVDLQTVDDSGDFDSTFRSWVKWNEASEPAIPTPWPAVNSALLGGLRRGRLYIIGGRPGCAKSTLGLNAALCAAMANYSTLIFSLEMGREEVMSRLISNAADVRLKDILSHRLGVQALEKINAFANGSMKPPISIDDSSSHTIESIMAKCRAKKPSVVLIDYLQLLDASQRNQPEHKQAKWVSRNAKLLSRRLDCAVILLSQLNRSIEQDNSKRKPRMADLAEGGEQDADVVMILTRPEGHDITAHVVKNRLGQTGAELTLGNELNFARLGR